MYLFIDVETTGLSPEIDRVVQLAWIVAAASGRIQAEQNHVIRPSGFAIPAAATRIHGITTDRALRDGVPLNTALTRLVSDSHNCSFLVAHNAPFDVGFVRAECRRTRLPDATAGKSVICTMKASTDFCKLPKTRGFGYKTPKLIELYRILFGRSFAGAHDAQADVQACMEAFFELKERGVLGTAQLNRAQPHAITQEQRPVNTHDFKGTALKEENRMLADELTEEKELRAHLARQVVQLQKQLEENETAKDGYAALIAELNHLRQERRGLEATASSLRAANAALQTKIESHKRIIEIAREGIVKGEELLRLRDEHRRLLKAVTDFRQERAELKQALDEQTKRANPLENQKLKRELEQMEERFRLRSSEIERLMRENKTLKKEQAAQVRNQIDKVELQSEIDALISHAMNLRNRVKD